MSDVLQGLLGIAIAVGIVLWVVSVGRGFARWWASRAADQKAWLVALAIGLGLLLLVFSAARERVSDPELGRQALWVAWPTLVLTQVVLFVVWSWVPLELLDKLNPAMNPIGRPVLNTVVLTGLPVAYAAAVALPAMLALAPFCLLMSLYSSLSGRILDSEKRTAGWTVIACSVSIWFGASQV